MLLGLIRFFSCYLSGFFLVLLAGCQVLEEPKYFDPVDNNYATNGIINDPDEYFSMPHEITRIQAKECYDTNERRNIAILFDGTDNVAESDTNISRIRNMLIAQPPVNGCPRNYVLYIKGAGTEGWWLEQLLGAAFGIGTDEDVRQAYTYISKFYRGPQDRLYIIGFSRGASSARVLTSMLHMAGIPKPFPKDDSFVESIYEQYRANEPYNDKKSKLAQLFTETNHGYSQMFAPVTFLGLFDTVHALGIGHRGEYVSQLKENFSESLCHVKHTAQALSIDDNRSKLFTPALLHKGLLAQCPERLARIFHQNHITDSKTALEC